MKYCISVIFEFNFYAQDLTIDNESTFTINKEKGSCLFLKGVHFLFTPFRKE